MPGGTPSPTGSGSAGTRRRYSPTKPPPAGSSGGSTRRRYSPSSSSSSASATDDPHVENLAGERFQVKQPGTYSMIRVPPEESSAALLEMDAHIKPEESAPCRMYIKGVTVRGRWLGKNVVHVLPLMRDRHGSNTAGSAIKRPFSIKLSLPSGNQTLSWDDLEAGGGARVLGSGATVQTFLREELGGVQEAHAFKLLVGASDKRAEIVIAQASHQALNTQLNQAMNLESPNIGGLLGTEGHNERIEKPAQGCLDSIYGMVAWVDPLNTQWASELVDYNAASWD